MKGLLKKEWYLIKYDCRYYLLLLFLFLMFNCFSEDSFNNTFVWVIPATIVISLLGFDEKYKWDNYCLDLPVSIENYVDAKYIVGAIIISLTFIFSVVIRFILKKELLIEGYITGFTISLLSLSFTSPVYFRYGSNRGRIAYYILIGLTVAIITLINTDKLGNFAFISSPITLFMTSIVIFIISRFLSSYLYKLRLKEAR